MSHDVHKFAAPQTERSGTLSQQKFENLDIFEISQKIRFYDTSEIIE